MAAYENLGNEVIAHDFVRTITPALDVTRRRWVGYDDEQMTVLGAVAAGVSLATVDVSVNAIGSIAVAGSPLVETGGVFSKGDPITNDTSGRAILGTETNLHGRAEAASGASGEFVPVLLLGLGTQSNIVVHTDATLTVTEALHNGKVITLDRAGGIVVTMPEPTGTGMVITFRVITTFTSDTTIVLPDTTNTTLIGGAHIEDSDTAGDTQIFTPAATHDLVTLDGTNTGGGLGCLIRYTDLAVDLWSVEIIEYVGGTAPATPFSST